MKRIVILLFFNFAVLLYAGDPSRKGTTGAEQLLIPVGAQSIATSWSFFVKCFRSGINLL